MMIGGPKLYSKLLEAPKSLKPLQIEDVFLTGFVAEAAGVSRFSAPGFIHDKITIKRPPCDYLDVIAARDVNSAEKRDLWQYFKDSQSKTDLRVACSKENN